MNKFKKENNPKERANIEFKRLVEKIVDEIITYADKFNQSPQQVKEALIEELNRQL